jgi:hypothetical protein
VHHRTDTRPVDHRSTRRHVGPAAAVGSIALIAALLLTTAACGSGASPAAAGTSRADAGDPTPTAWRGDQFVSAGSIGEPLAGLGDEAQIDRASGIVLFRVGDDVLQAHVLSPGRHGRALDVARALADAL